MASSLASQLAQIAAKSKSSLDIKAQKASHSKSLLFEPKVAASQSFQSLYTICFEGFEELCLLDARFKPFGLTLFSEQSQDEDRTQMTAAENAELDQKIESFLRLVGSRLRLMPSIRAIEWLVRRFRAHEFNTKTLLTTFFPYHTVPAFVTLLSILPPKLPTEYRFLHPYVRSLTAPPRSVLVHEAIQHHAFLATLSDYTLEACRHQQQYPALVSFWGGIMTEAVNGILDNSRSGRQSIQAENDQALLHRVGPIFGEALLMKKASGMQVAAYMAISIFAAKGNLDDGVLSAFMEQIVLGWTSETMRPGLVCLSILAQYRSAKQVSGKVTKSLMKVPDLGEALVEIGRQHSIDKLANGLCISLIDRLCKKGDARGLPVIRAILVGQVLKEKQIGVVFKSLVLAAHRLDDDLDQDGHVRKDLGSTLIDLSRHTGDASDVIRGVIEEGDLDVEDLEMKLDVTIRQQQTLPGATDQSMDVDGASTKPARPDVPAALTELSAREGGLPTCLTANAGKVYDEFSQLFLQVVAQSAEDPSLLAKFQELPALRQGQIADDWTYASFFIRIWCGPFPTLARVAALESVRTQLAAGAGKDKDAQALVPYCLIAMLDSSRKVRQVAAATLAPLAASLSECQGKGKKRDLWGGGDIYGGDEKKHSMGLDVCLKLLQDAIRPSTEECIMHEDHLATVLQANLDSSTKTDKKPLSQSARQAVFTSLAGHVVATPLLRAKSSLLSIMNRIKNVSSVSRTKVLLPALQWWGSLDVVDVEVLCEHEQIDPALLHRRFVDVVVPNDHDGLELLLGLIKAATVDSRMDLISACYQRIREMWASMKADTKYDVAQTMFELYQRRATSEEVNVVADEAAVLLKNVDLTTDILAHYLTLAQERTKAVNEAPPNKRRRTSTDGARATRTQSHDAAEIASILRDVTFVLQLVEGSEPRTHPELLDGLFATLAELQRFSAAVGSELGYLQNLVLTSLIAMVPEYKNNKNLKITGSGNHGDLLANCIQKSTSPIVQNSALLLIAGLASAAPDVVLHSVMPIFTFMGASVLRQNDDYSAHVVNQTIEEVVPPLMESLKKGKRNPVAGVRELLVSFVTAYEHIPSHRKQDLFVSLVNTLGPEEFLFALIAMLIDKYGANESMETFASGLLAVYSAEVQLQTLAKLLDLISDIFRSKPGLSSTLLGIGDEIDKKDTHATALQQMTIFPSLMSGRKLKKEISILSKRDDMETSKMRELYATLLKDTLTLADTVKSNKPLHECCGSSLANLLNLLSIGEFIKAVEDLLDKTEIDLRRKVLRALEVRVEQEHMGDSAARAALLGFLPQLTAAIRDTDDLKYKHTAVSCVDKIAEKYGKKDPEAVAAAATTIAGPLCLGTTDVRLRIMALLCLSSLVDVLQDGILPVLSLAVPQAILYIRQGLNGDESQTELHNAGYSFITALAQHLPYMISGAYLREIMDASTASASADLDEDANDSRLNCVRFLARKVDPKVFFTAMVDNWAAANKAGFEAVGEYIDVLGVAIDSHPKSVIAKNVSSLSTILHHALDLRREHLSQAEQQPSAADLEEIDDIEASINDVALKMIYKLNDAAFRPIFTNLMEWSTQLPKHDAQGKLLRRYSVYGFLHSFFDNLKSIVTSYATYVVDDAVEIIKSSNVRNAEQRRLWERALSTLSSCFEHDQDDFWQAPAHFSAVAPVLVSQFSHASAVDLTATLIPAVVELANAADSQDHQKELNTTILRHLRDEQASVRLAAAQCQQELTDKLGEEWLSSLPEMLPYISELQDDDDEEVEKNCHKWILKIEGVLGESLDSMLQ